MTSWQRALQKLELNGTVEVPIAVLVDMMRNAEQRAHWSVKLHDGQATIEVKPCA